LEASLEGTLQLTVETLHKTVGLWAISRRVGGGDPEQLVEFRPHVAGELRATVRGDVIRHSKA
jgi:O-acetyl-ADP-ribose deacetylase (regulator of RNase III)